MDEPEIIREYKSILLLFVVLLAIQFGPAPLFVGRLLRSGFLSLLFRELNAIRFQPLSLFLVATLILFKPPPLFVAFLGVVAWRAITAPDYTNLCKVVAAGVKTLLAVIGHRVAGQGDNRAEIALLAALACGRISPAAV